MRRGISMATLSDYRGTLPYASELFGVYQPLLGWRSRRIKDRYDTYRSALYQRVARRALSAVKTRVEVEIGRGNDDQPEPSFTEPGITVRNLEPAVFPHRTQAYVASAIDSAVARLLRKQIGDAPNWT